MRGPGPAIRELVGSPTGRKLVRYSATSVLNVLVGQAVLAVAFGYFHWSARAAAVLAAIVAAFPAYWMARRWVWGKSGRSHLLKEVLPFWTLALIGLAVTTAAAGVAEDVGAGAGLSRPGQTIVVMGAVLGVSAVFWVVRFLLLNGLLFRDPDPAAGPPPG